MRSFLLVLITLIFYSCSPISQHALTKTFHATEEKFRDHTGFALYDLEKKKTVFEYNAARYFTPASNTKIFTFFSSLKLIGDSIPALKYITQGDSLIFWGTGDPSLFYKNVYQNQRVFDFFKSTPKQLYFSKSNFYTTHFGPGWAWDDYNDYYSAERSSFPVYGNIFSVKSETANGELNVSPDFFKPFINQTDTLEEAKIVRQIAANKTRFYPGRKSKKKEWDIPFHVDSLLTVQLLSDSLDKKVTEIAKEIVPNAKVLYSIPSDSLYKVMMQESDNFIAEQLLLMCSGILSDSLKPEIAIEFVKKNFLSDFKDEPIWVDGSGLSRYNLFTPRSIVQLWEKIYQQVPRERLFTLLATGGQAGTIRNWYLADRPYIFGKTGSLSNNHCLSGYLVTKKGKTLIFSFMNSNFIVRTAEVRKNMQKILNEIYEKY